MKKLYCIPQISELGKYLDFSEKYEARFEYNDFFVTKILDDKDAIERIVKTYRDAGRDMSGDIMHGAFLDICVNSADSKIFAASDYRVRQCMDIARDMGLRAVVFHTNYIVNFRLRSYIKAWIESNEAYWRAIIREYPEQKIFMENMFDDAPFMLSQLAWRMRDEPNFGVCFDVAHAFISGSPLDAWFDKMRPYAVHLHINDNDGSEDLHAPVGSGKLDWNDFNKWCLSLDDAPSALIEVRSYADLIRSVKFMEQNDIYPF